MEHYILQTPFEDLLHHDIAGSLWPWLAAVTAAISLLGIIRAATIFLIRASHHDPSTSAVPTVTFQESLCCPPPAPAVKLLAESSSQAEKEECLGTPKARFTVYYSHVASDSCQFEEEITQGDVEEEELCLGDGTCKFSGGKWEDKELVWVDERVLFRRKRDLGWYRCQERTMINGSVVKFWDKASSSSPRRA